MNTMPASIRSSQPGNEFGRVDGTKDGTSMRTRTRRRKKKAAAQSRRDTAGNSNAGAPSEEQNSDRRAMDSAPMVPSMGTKRRRVYGRSSSDGGSGSIVRAPVEAGRVQNDQAVDEFDFVDESNDVNDIVEDDVPPRPNLLHVLPALLYLRDTGISRHRLVARTNKGNDAATGVVGNIRGNGREGWWRSLALCQLKATESNNRDNDDAVAARSKGGSYQWEWRPYAQRSIPFTDLDTSPTDAILALDREASYMIGLGGARCGDEDGRAGGEGSCRPILAIRFYGVPSVAALKRHSRSKRRFAAATAYSPSPLLLAIPLLIESDSDENRNLTAPSSLLVGESSGSAAANIPVRILTSCDGALGVAFLLHSISAASSSPVLPDASLVGYPAVRDEDALGTIFLFPLPGHHSHRSRMQLCNEASAKLVQSYKCANVRVVGGLRSHTIRNLLWPTNHIPIKMATRERSNGAGGSCNDGIIPWCDSFQETSPGYNYLLFNDEDDGYRMTWVLVGGSEDSNGSMNSKPSTGQSFGVPLMYSIKATRTDIITVPDEEVWTETTSDCRTGNVVTANRPDEINPSSMRITFEAFFSVEALLSDIFSRRHSFAHSSTSTHAENHVHRLPNYFYSLISVSDSGRTIVLVVVFACGEQRSAQKSKPKPAAVGIFVRIDIFDLSYDELEFVQHPSRSDSKFLRHWSNTLALNWRMREKRIGVYSLEENAGSFQTRRVNTASVHESNTGRDELDDIDPNVWERTESDGKKVAMSSLYPFCDLISNKAVTSAEPVLKICCRNSPIELTYK